MLEKNLKFIEKQNIELYNKLKQLPQEQNKIEILETKDGNYTVKVDAKLLHSLYRPQKEAEKIINNVELENKKIILVFGFGFGYYIEEISKRINEDVEIFIFQEDLQILNEALRYRDFEAIFKKDNIYFFTTNQKYEMLEKFEKHFKVGLLPEYEIIKHKIEYERNKKEYTKVYEYIKNMLSTHLVNSSTIFEFSKLWQKNRFYNLKHFANSIGVDKFFEKFKNKPIIIVAAGPSLDKNIKYLHWIKNKAIIIAVGTVLKKLEKEKIIPDLIVSLDAGEANWEHFRRVDYEKIPILYELMINTKILDHHIGEKIIFASTDIISEWGEEILGKKGFIKSGGTVALTGYDFAVKIGGNPIILLGQDLAYSGGKTHASSTVYEKDKIGAGYNLEVEDIYGKKVMSDIKFKTFKEFFERFISKDKKMNEKLMVFDCTEGGAKIKGTEVKSIKDVYFNYIESSDVDFEKVLEVESKKKLNKIQKLEDEKIKLKSNLERLNKFLEKAIKETEKIIKEKKDLKKLEKIEEKIKNEISISKFINSISQPIIAKVMKETQKSENLKSILEVNLKLYKGLKDSVEFNLECLEEK